MASQARALSDCLNLVIWQYDQRGEPPRAEMLERQRREILESGADAVLRGWFKWGGDMDYGAMHGVAQAVAASGGLFCGGLTCSVLRRGENGLDDAALLDMSTRPAWWGAVAEASAGLEALPCFGEKCDYYYLSIHNPRTVEYLADCAARQIAAGARALHLDEIWAIGTRVSVLDNVGYDDYAVQAFGPYLRRKYPRLRDEDWKCRFAIDDMDAFEYRHYLRERGWARDPDAFYGVNPLAEEWKTPLVLEPTVCETWFEPDAGRSFYEWSVLDFSQRLCKAIHQRAANLGCEIALAHNGPWPGMDFQNWNVPFQAPGTDYGSFRCHLQRWRRFRDWSDRWSGPDAPAVAFLDWPGDLPVFGACPRHKQECFLRTVPAECHGAGCAYAFHLRNLMGDAREWGVLGLMQELCRWYRRHRWLYRPRGKLLAPVCPCPDICLSAWARSADVVLHLVNHRQQQGVIEPVYGVDMELPEDLQLSGDLETYSPDPANRRPALRLDGRRLRIDYIYAHAVARLPLRCPPKDAQ